MGHRDVGFGGYYVRGIWPSLGQPSKPFFEKPLLEMPPNLDLLLDKTTLQRKLSDEEITWTDLLVMPEREQEAYFRRGRIRAEQMINKYEYDKMMKEQEFFMHLLDKRIEQRILSLKHQYSLDCPQYQEHRVLRRPKGALKEEKKRKFSFLENIAASFPGGALWKEKYGDE